MKIGSAIFLVSSLIGFVPANDGFARQTAGKNVAAAGKTGSWKKMSQAAPVQARGIIGSVQAGNKFVVWGGEIRDKPVSDGAVYDMDADVWKKMSDAPVEGREHFTMLAYGGKVIIWGGENNPYGAIYDIAADTWKKMAGSPIVLGAEPYTSGIIGDKLLVWGIGKTRELNPVGGIYDIEHDTWKKMAAPAAIKAIDDWPACIYKDKFFVWGTPRSDSSGIYGAIYDIEKDEWKDMAPAPIERRNWSAVGLAGNKLVIWGGCPGPVEARSGQSRSDGAVYDMEKDAWKKMAPAPLEPRFLPRSFVWDRKVIIWGGLKDKFYYDGAIYDVEKDTWEKIPEAPLKGKHPRELYSYGIFGYNPTPLDLWGHKLVVWSFYCNAVYDLEKKIWNEMTPAPFGGRDYHASFLYGSKLIIWGGRDEKSTRRDGAICDFGR